LALNDIEIAEKLESYRQKQTDNVLANRKLVI
jgi:hypothetical protein